MSAFEKSHRNIDFDTFKEMMRKKVVEQKPCRIIEHRWELQEATIIQYIEITMVLIPRSDCLSCARE